MAQGLKLLWRQLLRLERPRQALVRWRAAGMAAVFLSCLVVALVSSWPWLVEPSLRPGLPAPFTVRAPRDSRVIDSAALERRRSQMGPRSQVQIVDPSANRILQEDLERRKGPQGRTLVERRPGSRGGVPAICPIAHTGPDHYRRLSLRFARGKWLARTADCRYSGGGRPEPPA